MSVRQAVTTTGLAEDVEKELEEIKNDASEEAKLSNKTEVKKPFVQDEKLIINE